MFFSGLSHQIRLDKHRNLYLSEIQMSSTIAAFSRTSS
jgi:hypothetical protein